MAICSLNYIMKKLFMVFINTATYVCTYLILSNIKLFSLFLH